MLVIPHRDAWLIVAQPEHGRMTGEIAAAWGNERFGSFEPRDEMIAGAVHHDDGWAKWEAAPTLDPQTGLPSAFDEIPPPEHPAIDERSAALLAGQYPYAALVVSTDRVRLVRVSGRFAAVNPAKLRVRAFRKRCERFQEELRDQLGEVDPERFARNLALLRIWDLISLDTLLDRVPVMRANIPAAAGTVDIGIAQRGSVYTIDPWPFGGDRIELTVEGTLLRQPFDDAETMRAALTAAPREALRVILEPV